MQNKNCNRKLLSELESYSSKLGKAVYEFTGAMGERLIGNTVFFDHVLIRLAVATGGLKVNDLVSGSFPFDWLDDGLDLDGVETIIPITITNELQCLFVFLSGVGENIDDFIVFGAP